MSLRKVTNRMMILMKNKKMNDYLFNNFASATMGFWGFGAPKTPKPLKRILKINI